MTGKKRVKRKNKRYFFVILTTTFDEQFFLPLKESKGKKSYYNLKSERKKVFIYFLSPR